MRQFFKSVVHSAEVKRGASHLLVGIVVGVISALVHRSK